MSQERFDRIHMAERETASAEIIWMGKLGGEKPDPRIWSGTIPAEEFRLTPKAIAEAKQIVNEYFVPTDPNSPVRCIDERPRAGYEHGADDIVRLGPQVPGGTPAAALSYRAAKFSPRHDKYPQEVLVDDMFELNRIYQALKQPFRIGAHKDNHAQYPNTGCGAIDNLPSIMDRQIDPHALPAVQAYTEAILEDEFDPDCFMESVAVLQYLNEPDYKKTYLQQDDQLGTDYRDLVLPMVEKEAKDERAVEEMVGPHKAFALIVNKRPGSTLDRDGLNRDFNGRIQAFNYDAWFVERGAKALWPQDETARRVFLTSRTQYCIATAMVLTNGNIEVGIRR
jgi:hypothetical protein